MIFRNPFKQKSDIVNIIFVLIALGFIPFLNNHLYAIITTVIMIYAFIFSTLIVNKLIRILFIIIFLAALIVCTINGIQSPL